MTAVRATSGGWRRLLALVPALLLVLLISGVASPSAEAMIPREQDTSTPPGEDTGSGEEGRELPSFESGRTVTVIMPPSAPRMPGEEVQATVTDGRTDPVTGTISVELPGGLVEDVEVDSVVEDAGDTYSPAATGPGEGYCAPADAADCAVSYEETENTGSFLEDTYQTTFSNCWMCTFVAAITMAADQFARSVYVDFAGAIGGLLATIFSFWIVLQGTKLMFPSMAESPGKVIKNVFLVSIGYVMVVFLIDTPTFMLTPLAGETVAEEGGEATFFDWGPELVLSTGAGAAIELTSRMKSAADEDLGDLATSAPSSVSGASAADTRQCGGWDEDRIAPLVDFGGDSPTDNMSAISRGTLGELTCLVHQIQISAGFGMVIGSAMIEGVSPGIGTFTTFLPGWVLWLIFAMAVVAFAFYLLDAIIRIAVMSALAPVLLGMLLFPATRGMAGTGIQVIVSGGASLIGLGMVFALGATMISMVPVLVTDGNGDPVASSLFEMIQKIAGVHESGDQIDGEFNIFEGGFWYLLMCGVLLNKLMKRVGELVKTVLNTFQSDPDSMGAGSQSLMLMGGKTAAFGTGAFVFGTALGQGGQGAAAAAGDGAGAAAGGAQKAGVLSSYAKAKGWMSSLGGRIDEELGE